jgi:gas vesicle protein
LALAGEGRAASLQHFPLAVFHYFFHFRNGLPYTTAHTELNLGAILARNFMTAQTATLIAAVLAAIAAIFAAAVSSRTARRVAKETAQAESERELSAFRREQVRRNKEVIFENGVVLQTLTSCCQFVPWLAKTSLADIQERGSAAISRINYAMQELTAMNAIERTRLESAWGLGYSYMLFTGKLAAYREQIDAGNIALSGEGKEAAKVAEGNVLEAQKNWQEQLNELRVLTAEIRVSV